MILVFAEAVRNTRIVVVSNMSRNECPKCGSTNITFQVLTNTIQKNKHHGILWWLVIGWWWIPVKWIFFTGLALFFFILKLFGVRKKKNVIIDRKIQVCQNCGHYWNV